jgi:murein L,D-transpeptidase YcbB/YkuD
MVRHATLIGITAFALFLVGAGRDADAAAAPLTGEQSAAIVINLADLLANEPGLPLPVRQRYDALNSYYQEQAGPLLWIGSDRMVAFVERLSTAQNDGLDGADYPIDRLAELADVVDETDIRGKAIIELYFSAAFLEYASDLQVGRFLPRTVDPNFFLQAREIDPLAALNGALDTSDLNVFFDRWQPQLAAYADLKQTLADYRALDAVGGWPSVPLGDALKPGTSDPRVPALRARLAVTEGVAAFAPPGGEDLYDDELVAAVQAFQARHGLEIDGIAGNQTMVALNVPVEDRIDAMVVAMERWRWMPPDLGADHLMVNIAGFDLRFVRDGVLADHMAVVVGKPYHKTPVFSHAVRTVEFNPYWYVPSSIAINEELPKLKSNPAALAALGFEAVQGDRVIPVTAVDWRRYGPGNFPFSLRQRPGPRNALGRAKFLFPNKFNVYLHDTPSRSLFARAERAFSHGCVRLERPIDLAEEVLGLQGGWNRQRIDGVLASGDRTVVPVETPLPVHIAYFTAWVDSGQPNFRGDIYAQDEKLIAALAGKTIAW